MSQPFIWRAQDGDVPVTAMLTPHLFYTVRMIWNSSVALPFRVGDKRRQTRSFGPRHPPEYLKKAFIALVDELAGRSDLSAEFSKQITEITEHLKANPALAQHIGAAPRTAETNSRTCALVKQVMESQNYEAGLMYRPR